MRHITFDNEAKRERTVILTRAPARWCESSTCLCVCVYSIQYDVRTALDIPNTSQFERISNVIADLQHIICRSEQEPFQLYFITITVRSNMSTEHTQKKTPFNLTTNLWPKDFMNKPKTKQTKNCVRLYARPIELSQLIRCQWIE